MRHFEVVEFSGKTKIYQSKTRNEAAEEHLKKFPDANIITVMLPDIKESNSN